MERRQQYRNQVIHLIRRILYQRTQHQITKKKKNDNDDKDKDNEMVRESVALIELQEEVDPSLDLQVLLSHLRSLYEEKFFYLHYSYTQYNKLV